MDTTDNEKFNQILRTSRSLFWKHGIKRVTIEEICQEANVSKATFYKHFNNKIELVKRIIDWIAKESMDKYRKIMEQDISFEEKIKRSVELKMEQTDAMSSEFYNDYLLHADPELSAYLGKTMGEGLSTILGDYTEAQERGDIRSDIKPEFILYFLNHMVTIAEDPNLLDYYKRPQDLIMELTNFFFYGVLPRNHGNNAKTGITKPKNQDKMPGTQDKQDD
jgi:AcrR family transcriptional regulator